MCLDFCEFFVVLFWWEQSDNSWMVCDRGAYWWLSGFLVSFPEERIYPKQVNYNQFQHLIYCGSSNDQPLVASRTPEHICSVVAAPLRAVQLLLQSTLSQTSPPSTVQYKHITFILVSQNPFTRYCSILTLFPWAWREDYELASENWRTSPSINTQSGSYSSTLAPSTNDIMFANKVVI